MATTSQGALSPRAPSAGQHSNGSSDFLLLTTETTPLFASSAREGSEPLPPPRPRFLPVLQLTALLDVLVTLALALRVPISALPRSAVALNLGRGVLVGAVVSTQRVRDMAPVMLGQVVLSALVLLFRLNELVQRTSAPLPSLPAILRNPTTAWYLASFAFSLAHYALFACVVGLRRRRTRGAAEERWDGAVERVRARSFGGGAESASALSEEEEELAFSSAEEDDADGAAHLSSDDENDIIDVPSPSRTAGLRNRASRASLLSAFSPPLAPGEREGDRPGLRASRGYGSIRSLAGI